MNKFCVLCFLCMYVVAEYNRVVGMSMDWRKIREFCEIFEEFSSKLNYTIFPCL